MRSVESVCLSVCQQDNIICCGRILTIYFPCDKYKLTRIWAPSPRCMYTLIHGLSWSYQLWRNSQRRKGAGLELLGRLTKSTRSIRAPIGFSSAVCMLTPFDVQVTNLARKPVMGIGEWKYLEADRTAIQMGIF